RYKRVIQNENIPLPPNKVRNMWLSKINKRLKLNCRMTYKHFRKKALNKDLVLHIWSGAILDENKLPKDWTEVNGVLVGITL
ncbi:hypothetical protein EV421DRAFT_1723395, partial [Armillaria borealis]